MEKSMNTSGTTSNASGATSSKEGFKNTPHVATGALDADASGSIMEQARPAMDFVKKNFSNVSDSAVGYYNASAGILRRNPLYAILGAAAIVGFGAWIYNSRYSTRSSSDMNR